MVLVVWPDFLAFPSEKCLFGKYFFVILYSTSTHGAMVCYERKEDMLPEVDVVVGENRWDAETAGRWR